MHHTVVILQVLMRFLFHISIILQHKHKPFSLNIYIYMKISHKKYTGVKVLVRKPRLVFIFTYFHDKVIYFIITYTVYKILIPDIRETL